MNFLAEKMREQIPDSLVHIAVCNASQPRFGGNLTHDGIDSGGERLAREIRACIENQECRKLHYISFVGNSMGGLFSRYAIGILYEPDTGTICGLTPISFITTVTPHLSLHGFVSPVVEQVVANLHRCGGAQLYGGRTGEQIFLADADCAAFAAGPDADPAAPLADPAASFLMPPCPLGAVPILARDFPRLQTPRGEPPTHPFDAAAHAARASAAPATGEGGGSGAARAVPLLVAMSTDRPRPFRAALRAFRHRVAYGNTCNDPVRYPTATIAAGDFPGWQARPPVSPAFPHIIHDSLVPHARWPPPPRPAPLAPAPDAPSSPARPPPGGGGGGGSPGAWGAASPGGGRRRAAAAAGRDYLVGVMRRNLEGLGWRRVSARFARSVRVGERLEALPGLLGAVGVDAHNHLSVVRPALNGPGRDTVAHVCRVLAEHARSPIRGGPPGADSAASAAAAAAAAPPPPGAPAAAEGPAGANAGPHGARHAPPPPPASCHGGRAPGILGMPGTEGAREIVGS
jgi:hypothetical protein